MNKEIFLCSNVVSKADYAAKNILSNFYKQIPSLFLLISEEVCISLCLPL